jgi:hypothetical protein
MAVTPLVDDTMVVRHVQAEERDVVFIRGVLEASSGVGALFSEGGGDLYIAAHVSRAAELDLLLDDLRAERLLR